MRATMGSWNTGDNEILIAMVHPIKRRIIECLRDANLSFTELLIAVGNSDHGKFGYHLRALKGFIELDSSTKRYRLTHRGKLLDACIQSLRFVTAINTKARQYVQRLRFGDHAVGFCDADYFKRKISFPFLEVGLSEGEAVVYLVSEHKLDSEIRELKRYGVDFDSLQKESFTIMSAYEWYLDKGKACAETIIDNWMALLKERQKAGFKGLRAAAEMEVFFDYGKSKEVLRYEAMLGRYFASSICGLCLYDARRLDEEQFMQLNRSHGHLISKDIIGKTIV